MNLKNNSVFFYSLYMITSVMLAASPTLNTLIVRSSMYSQYRYDLLSTAVIRQVISSMAILMISKKTAATILKKTALCLNSLLIIEKVKKPFIECW